MPPAPLRVLEVIGNAILGGVETWAERFVERSRERIRFTVLVPAEGPYTDRLRALDVDVHVVQMSDSPHWASLQTALALVQAEGIDVLHAHLPRAHVLAGIVGRLAGRPVLATVHGREIGMLDLEVHRATGSHLSVVCRQSYFHALGLGVSPEQLHCVPNGVDTTVFCHRPRGHSALRESLGLAQEAPLIGFVGRLSPEKGPEVFIRAVQQLQQGHAVIVGDGPMLVQMRALAQRLELAGRLHFVGQRDDMPTLYGELDVVVSSSHSEAMPLALMEAMASGLPVIATRVGGVPDLVEHGQTGWLVQPGAVNDIAAHCTALLADDTLRRRMGERARRRAAERFDLGEGVRRMGEVLGRLAGREPEVEAGAQAVETQQFLRQS